MTFISKKLRILPLTVALATTFSLGTVAFATAPTCTTTTTYIGTNKVSVTSKITGADLTDQITFLVAKANPSQPTDFFYIDQTTAVGGEATFKFSTSTANLNPSYSATVKFGAQTTADIATASGNGVAFNLATQVPEPATRRVSDPGQGTALAPYNASKSLLSITTFGTLFYGTASDSCGILFSDDPVAIAQTFTNTEIADMTISSASVKKFTALGSSMGTLGTNGRNMANQFAIQLVNGSESGFLTAGDTYYTRTFGVYGSLVTLGDVIPVTIPNSL